MKHEASLIQRRSSEVEDEVHRITDGLRGLRADLKATMTRQRDAKLAFDRASLEAEALRESLEAMQPADTTKISVYEAAIEVMCSFKCLIIGSAR
jgi:hypothetical protein